jgi:hypothetical protein
LLLAVGVLVFVLRGHARGQILLDMTAPAEGVSHTGKLNIAALEAVHKQGILVDPHMQPKNRPEIIKRE